MADPWDRVEGMRGPNAQRGRLRGVHHDTFVTYRPSNQCWLCKKVTSKEDFEPPTDTDYVCLHVRRTELEAVMNAVTRGEAVNMGMETITLQSGVVQVTMTWADVDAPKEEAEQQRPRRM